MRKSLIFNDYANTPGEIINDLWKFPTVISKHNKTGKERQWMIFIGTNRGMNKEWFTLQGYYSLSENYKALHRKSL